MAERRATLGFIGMALGSLALLAALVHFYAGPFAPQPTMEQTVAEKAVAIRDATVAALKGEEVESAARKSSIDTDKAIMIGTSVLGGLAIILGVFGFARDESMKVALGAGVLGSAAIAFQFIAVALGMIVFAIILAGVLSVLDFG